MSSLRVDIINALTDAEKANALAAMTDGKFTDLSTVEVIFNRIKDSTTQKPLEGVRFTYTDIAREINQATADALYEAIETLKALGKVKPWVSEALISQGIDVNDPGTQAQLDAMVVATLLTPGQAMNLKSLGYEEVVDFPRLKLGHVQNALQAHARGEV